jgi:hypothetical protein
LNEGIRKPKKTADEGLIARKAIRDTRAAAATTIINKRLKEQDARSASIPFYKRVVYNNTNKTDSATALNKQQFYVSGSKFSN